MTRPVDFNQCEKGLAPGNSVPVTVARPRRIYTGFPNNEL